MFFCTSPTTELFAIVCTVCYAIQTVLYTNRQQISIQVEQCIIIALYICDFRCRMSIAYNVETNYSAAQHIATLSDK